MARHRDYAGTAAAALGPERTYGLRLTGRVRGLTKSVRDGSRQAETARGFGSRQPGRALRARTPATCTYAVNTDRRGRAGETSRRLDSGPLRSLYVLMPIETLKDALSAGWRVHARCIDGKVDNTRSMAKCHYRAELDLETLVWTRGPHMSLAGLNDRMMCPRCGNRRVNLIFEPPTIAGRAGG